MTKIKENVNRGDDRLHFVRRHPGINESLAFYLKESNIVKKYFKNLSAIFF